MGGGWSAQLIRAKLVDDTRGSRFLPNRQPKVGALAKKARRDLNQRFQQYLYTVNGTPFHVMQLASLASQRMTHSKLRAQPVFERSEKEGKQGPTMRRRLVSEANQSPTHLSHSRQPVFRQRLKEGKEDTSFV